MMGTTRDTGTTMPEKILARSRRYRMLGGVCGGIAEWTGWDPTVVRLLYVVASIMSAAFPGTLVYIVLWLIMPEGDQ